LNEGLAEIPYTNGDITAASFPSQDTATGQGGLVIFTDRGAVSFDLHLPRDQWKTTTFQRNCSLNSTAPGHRAVTMVKASMVELISWRITGGLEVKQGLVSIASVH
jgi:hypothetical protein